MSSGRRSPLPAVPGDDAEPTTGTRWTGHDRTWPGDGAFPDDALAGLRVLVVDDDNDARELFAMVLRGVGAAVTAAGSVDEALAAFVGERPDVLVSDIGMPGEDGHSLIRRVRMLSVDAGGAVPAVALTAFTGPEHRARALASGFTMHLSKPVDPDRLIAVVGRLAAEAQSD